jgi:hypothetical protein
MADSEEALRLQIVALARVFKRSWVDMAEALTTVRKRRLFRRWGYDSLAAYAVEELSIKKATTEKLTGSYAAMAQHVPHVLDWDGVAQPLPTVESVDYFAKAVTPPEGEDEPPDELVEELKAAIFEERASAPTLRRRFNPVLHPKEEDEVAAELRRKLLASVRRVEALLVDVDGLTEERVEQVSTALDDLRSDLDAFEA